MKNKKMVYILIPVTLVVWGMIFYKIISGLHSGNDAAGFANSDFVPAPSGEVVSDTFSIHPGYRDPFLGKFIKKAVVTDATPTAVPVKKSAPVPVVSAWPTIVYGGLIRNQKSNKQLVMLYINGQSAAVKAGDVTGGVVLTKVFKDSIEVMFGKEKRFIRK